MAVESVVATASIGLPPPLFLAVVLVSTASITSPLLEGVIARDGWGIKGEGNASVGDRWDGSDGRSADQGESESDESHRVWGESFCGGLMSGGIVDCEEVTERRGKRRSDVKSGQ